jgi:hypothetical protein
MGVILFDVRVELLANTKVGVTLGIFVNVCGPQSGKRLARRKDGI